MDDRDIYAAAGITQDQSSTCGAVDPRKFGMVHLSAAQLKNISKMLNEKAAHMTREEIEREAIMGGGKDIAASPDEEVENRRRAAELKQQQESALAEKQRQYKEWESKQKK